MTATITTLDILTLHVPDHVCGMRTYDRITDLLLHECQQPARWFRCCRFCGVDGFACHRCRSRAIATNSCHGCLPVPRPICDAWVWWSL